MANKVTHFLTKEKIIKKNSFSVVREGYKKAIYFNTEKEYQNWLDDNKFKEEIKYTFNSIIGREKYTKLNAIFTKKLNIWIINYTYEEISFCLNRHKEILSSYRNMGLPYLVTVIENKLIETHDIFVNYKRNKNNKLVGEVDKSTEHKVNEYKFKKKKLDLRKLV